MALECPFADLIARFAAKWDVEEEHIAATIHWESGFNPRAIGDNGHSVGLMQLHDEGAGAGWTVEQRMDPAINIDVGTAFIRRCKDAFPGDIRTAISAYNQGIAGARKWGWTLNRGYVEGILSLYRMYKGEGIDLPLHDPRPLPLAPGCGSVPAGGFAMVFALGCLFVTLRRRMLAR